MNPSMRKVCLGIHQWCSSMKGHGHVYAWIDTLIVMLITFVIALVSMMTVSMVTSQIVVTMGL